MEQESQVYEVELTIKRYTPHNGNLLEHPDELEVFYGRKVLDPSTDAIEDYLDYWKNPAHDSIIIDGFKDEDPIHEPTPAETNFERYGE